MTDAELAAAAVPPADVERQERRATYEQRLRRRAELRRSTLCAGLDPTPEAIALVADDAADSASAHAAAIERFCALTIEAVRDHAVAVKPQLAWFELAGWKGMRALERAVAYARTAGLLVLLDAKRGDVPHTAAAYARAWLGVDAEGGAGGDAMTMHATVGRDSLEAMAAIAHERHCQLYALVHTSNPGAVELQGAELADGDPWWTRVARDVAATGCGAVVGATHPAVLRQARELMPAAPLLLPGIGAQGATVDDVVGIASPEAPPPLVASSRGLLPPAPCDPAAFRQHVTSKARALALQTEPLVGTLAGTHPS